MIEQDDFMRIVSNWNANYTVGGCGASGGVCCQCTSSTFSTSSSGKPIAYLYNKYWHTGKKATVNKIPIPQAIKPTKESNPNRSENPNTGKNALEVIFILNEKDSPSSALPKIMRDRTNTANT